MSKVKPYRILKGDTKDIIIQNSCLIPKNPFNTYKSCGPEAIIVNSQKMANRNLIFHLAMVTTLPKGIAYRTDLVYYLKKRRQLASKTYKLRREKRERKKRQII